MSTDSPITERPATTRSADGVQNLAPRRRSFGAWFADTGWRHLVAIVVSARA